MPRPLSNSSVSRSRYACTRIGALTALWACLGSKLSTYYLNLFDEPFNQGVANWRSRPVGSRQILDHGSDTAKACSEVVEMVWPVTALDHPPSPIHNGTLRSASTGRLAKWKDRAASHRPRCPAYGSADTPESLRGETTIDAIHRATAYSPPNGGLSPYISSADRSVHLLTVDA